jgi:pimeloyl-ACP methyl ester carboxylesterase
VPPAFSRHVRKWLPDAEQVIIDRCGHVPQVERPEETNALLAEFFARVERSEARGAPAPSRRRARAA